MANGRAEGGQRNVEDSPGPNGGRERSRTAREDLTLMADGGKLRAFLKNEATDLHENKGPSLGTNRNEATVESGRQLAEGSRQKAPRPSGGRGRSRAAREDRKLMAES